MPQSPFQAPPQPTGHATNDDGGGRKRGIERAAWIAIATNTSLAIGQAVAGLLTHAFSLVADAAHTLSDLIADLFILVANRHSADPADAEHPYGHGRIETIVSLLLGAMLIATGIGFLWSSGMRLQHIETLPAVHPAALFFALLTLVAKELLFRYILAASRRLKAPMLEANAWHARSDAASSLVVAVGIGGSIAGYPFLEPLGAAVVGFLILRMGVKLGRKAVGELIDTGLPEEDIARLRHTIGETPGVIGLHDLRTRRMAGRVLCDAHVQVDPRITVSDGHRISDNVYLRVHDAHPEVQDVLVHIDAEEDNRFQAATLNALPNRDEVATEVSVIVRDLLGATAAAERIQIHYLGQHMEVEVFLPPDVTPPPPEALRQRVQTWSQQHPHRHSLSFFMRIAP